MRTLNVLLAILLTVLVLEITALAWDITMTLDSPFTGIGGGLAAFALFSVSPVMFWFIGRYWPRYEAYEVIEHCLPSLDQSYGGTK